METFRSGTCMAKMWVAPLPYCESQAHDRHATSPPEAMRQERWPQSDATCKTRQRCDTPDWTAVRHARLDSGATHQTGQRCDTPDWTAVRHAKLDSSATRKTRQRCDTPDWTAVRHARLDSGATHQTGQRCDTLNWTAVRHARLDSGATRKTGQRCDTPDWTAVRQNRQQCNTPLDSRETRKIGQPCDTQTYNGQPTAICDTRWTVHYSTHWPAATDWPYPFHGLSCYDHSSGVYITLAAAVHMHILYIVCIYSLNTHSLFNYSLHP